MKLIWTDGAVEDLTQAVAFLARSSTDASARLAEAVLSRVELLQAMPYTGRKRRSDTAYELLISPWPYFVI